jgi:hypothetical protein
MDYVRREVEERKLVEEAIDPDGKKLKLVEALFLHEPVELTAFTFQMQMNS